MANTSSASQAASDKPQSKSHDTTFAANSEPSVSLESQVAFLQEFASPQSDQNAEDDRSGSLALLLQQLDAADGVAKGVESKLDKLLENLEGMLQGLEGKDGTSVGVDGGNQNESCSPEAQHQDANAKHSG